MKQTVLFYSSVSSKELFKIQQFYVVDINILRDLGYEVILSNKVFDAFRFWRYQLVFAYFYKWSFFVALIARLFGRFTYFTGGVDALEKNVYSKKRYYLQIAFMFLSNLVAKKCIVVSRSDNTNIRKFVLFKDKLSYSEHTIDVNRFYTNQKKDNFFSTIVWQGAQENVERKGVDLALKMFAELVKSSRYNEYKFYIIGKNGPGTPYLQQIVRDLDIEDKVIFTGAVSEEEKIELLKKSHFYFQLSKYEGFGLAALEALCASNIVIHSGKGGLSNPIYDSCIKLDIEKDVKIESKLLLQTIESFDYKRFYQSVERVRTYYSNERRKTDFSKIIGYAEDPIARKNTSIH